MQRSERQKAAIEGGNRNRRFCYRLLGDAERNSALKIVESNTVRRRFDGKPVRHKELVLRSNGASVLELHTLPELSMALIAHLRNVGLAEQREEIGQAGRPTRREIDILRVCDLQLRLERGDAQGHDEIRVANLFCRVCRDGYLISNALFLHAMRRGYEQDLCRFVPDGALEDTFPIIAAFEPEHIGKHSVAKRGQFRAEPQRESIVFRTCVTNEQRLARRVRHDLGS
jgi:hypothetical protein